MVRRFLNFFQRELTGLHEAAFLLGASALVSQLLALLRDRLLAHSFGAGTMLDVYYAAFRVPDLIYVSLGSFVSVTVVLPFLMKHLEKGEMAKAERLLADLFSRFLGLMLLVEIIAYLLMPYFLNLLVPGFPEEQKLELLKLARILLLSPLLLGLSNLFANVTQSSRKFFLYALSPILYNLSIIFGIIFFYPRWGSVGLAWGVILGALSHFAVQLPALYHGPVKLRFPLIFRQPLKEASEWWKIFILSWPRTLTLSANQLATMALVALASYLTVGSIAVFVFAYNLQSVILSIVGVSYSVAAFPTLVKLFTNGDRDQFLNQMVVTIRHIIFWTAPAMVLFIVLRAQIVRVILGSGKFDWSDTRLTAAALAIFLLSAISQGLILLFVRGYYACGRYRKPLFINVGSSLLVIILAFGLTRLFVWWPDAKFSLAHFLRVTDLAGVEILVLPLAFTIGSLVNLVLFWRSFRHDFGSFPKRLYQSLGQSASSSLVMGGTAYLILQLLAPVLDQTTFLGIFAQGLFAGLGGIGAGWCVLWWLGNEELVRITHLFRHKFWRRTQPILPAADEL